MNFSFRSRPIVLLPSVSVTGDVNDQVLFGFNGVWLQHREGPSLVAGLFVSGGLQRPNLAGMFMPSVTYGALFGGNDLLTRGPVHLASPLMFLQCTVGGGSNPMCGGGAQYTVGVDLWSKNVQLVGGVQGQVMRDFIAETVLVGFSAFVQVQGTIPFSIF